ncbi:protein TFG-like [Limulus polyphemus]|uniref:Protein TFG-like n=1 Tax=Limulus polyphemus TaxID=6850 RepID=A0ABM1S0C3_LIMPO|nr:protein TFG-like [Limulus polyphemus]XP_013792853.1 protein TFG-like [Limulus polyphemus]XP_022237078.1 protein TFG-like [Limulus polyphemus]
MMNNYHTSVTGTNDIRYPNLDLGGKLVIKAQLGDDIRRIFIHNEDITYDELILMMQRVFSGKLSSSDEVTLKYKDEDGDLITIFDSSDLSYAIQCSRILKLTISVNGQPTLLEAEEVKDIRKELQAIRDRVNQLLDMLDHKSVISTPSAAVTSSDGDKIVNVASSKEFDPLTVRGSPIEESVQSKVSSSLDVSEEHGRATTPDSVSSRSSSTSYHGQQQQVYPDSQQFTTNPELVDRQVQQSGLTQQFKGQSPPQVQPGISRPYAALPQQQLYQPLSQQLGKPFYVVGGQPTGYGALQHPPPVRPTSLGYQQQQQSTPPISQGYTATSASALQGYHPPTSSLAYQLSQSGQPYPQDSSYNPPQQHPAAKDPATVNPFSRSYPRSPYQQGYQ